MFSILTMYSVNFIQSGISFRRLFLILQAFFNEYNHVICQPLSLPSHSAFLSYFSAVGVGRRALPCSHSGKNPCPNLPFQESIQFLTIMYEGSSRYFVALYQVQKIFLSLYSQFAGMFLFYIHINAIKFVKCFFIINRYWIDVIIRFSFHVTDELL